MMSNFHTHTTYCDGKNTPEEIVQYAISKGFDSVGFSGHGYTEFDLRYCMKDTEGYIKTITDLKEKYKKDIQIYLGVEEDAFAPVDRDKFDYVIGSSHYFYQNGSYYPIDSDLDYFEKCYSLFDSNILKMAEVYFGSFCDYLLRKKPDIIGHFDLLTKFDEIRDFGFTKSVEYDKIAIKYAKTALKCGGIFEVNTGAIARGLKTAPYPHENILKLLQKENAKVILSSDSHEVGTLDCKFSEVKYFLKDIGFRERYTIDNGSFVPVPL